MSWKERSVWITIVFLLVSISFFQIEKANALSEVAEKELQVFHEVLASVESNYVDKPNDTDLYTGAIKGALSSLKDPHTRYLDETEMKEFQSETKGSFGGIGFEASFIDGVILVVAPYDDTPASRAGLLPGDRIIEIDGKSTKELGFAEAIKLLRGDVGSTVNLKVERRALPNPILFSIVRENIKYNYVKRTFLEEEKLGYVRLTQFMGKDTTVKEFIDALDFFSEKKAKGIIIDLRNNPGGLLEQAIQLSDVFLKPGLDIVSVKGRGNVLINTFKSTNAQKKYTEIPLVVLINNGSASASEILAGALQDNKRAKILGVTSFGKGSVQNYLQLSFKRGLALTIQKYFTPSGVSIHGKGIVPDLLVRPITPKDEEKFYLDKLFKKNIPKDFVKTNPDFTESNFTKFQEILEKNDIKISEQLAKYTLYSETMIGKKLPLVDREFDLQLNAAIKALLN